MRLDVLAAITLAIGIAIVEGLFLAGAFLFAWGAAIMLIQAAFR